MTEAIDERRPGELSLPELPSLILDEICKHLAASHRRRDLLAFSLTSRLCAIAAKSFIFENIYLHFHEEKDVQEQLSRLEAALGPQQQYFGYVRNVKFMGQGVSHQQEEEPEEEDTYHKPKTPGRPKGLPLEEVDPNVHEPSQEVGGLTEYDPFSLPLSDKLREQLEVAWEPVVRFITRLVHLKDIVYACTHDIPPSLLSAIHQHHPMARLHHETFSLRSVFCSRHFPRSYEFSSDDKQLLTSPCLHSLVARWSDQDSRGRHSFNPEAIMAMAAGLAPRLASISMWATTPKITYEFEIAERMSKRSWGGQFKDYFSKNPPSKGRLTDLAFSTNDYHGRMGINLWAKYIHLDELVVLRMKPQVSITEVRALIQASENTGFRCLRTLELGLFPQPWEEVEAMDAVAATFLNSLHPLETILLSGIMGEHTLDALSQTHSGTLRQLKVAPRGNLYRNKPSITITADHIIDLGRKLTQLKRLELRIRRTQGDAKEVDIYKALGQMCQLNYLSLLLDCTEYPPPKPKEAEETVNLSRYSEWTIPVWFVKDALTNTAIDSSYMESVFGGLTSYNSRLEYLKVQIVDVDRFGLKLYEPGTNKLFQWLSSGWECWKDHDGHIQAQELEGPAKPSAEDMFRIAFEGREDLKAVWNSLWPLSESGRLEWSSFPLAHPIHP